MTIKPGQAWGTPVQRPPDLVVVRSDHELAAALARGSTAIGVGGGDMARTLGVTPTRADSLGSLPTVNEYLIDLLEVRLDDSAEPRIACAHLVARSPWHSGHWLRGRLLVLMNAEFIGEWDVAPRGHPNDGRAEVFDVQASMTTRERLAARRRLSTGTHVPHPKIVTGSTRSGAWHFERPREVIIDGQRVGEVTTLSVTVIADAAMVYA